MAAKETNLSNMSCPGASVKSVADSSSVMKKSRKEGPLGLWRGNVQGLIPVTEEERKQNFTQWINALQGYCKCCGFLYSSESNYDDKN